MSERRFKAYGAVGIILFVIAVGFMRQGREPFASYFYCFAWWSYIMVADACVHRAGGVSLLTGDPRRFVTMTLLSVFIWSVFEAFNFRLDNWHYINVPEETWRRWLGYAVAYGTVLPGLCVTTRLVRLTGVWKGFTAQHILLSTRGRAGIMCVGIACVASTIAFPRYTFPLVWVGGVLALDPVNYRWGVPSVGRDLEFGDLERTLNIMTAGLICGFLWEFWNFWAQVKWIYTVPFFEWGKVFEMPVAGYFGFPPFAVSAFLLYHGLARCVEKTSGFPRVALWMSVAVVCGLVFYGIDRFTVVSYVPRGADVPRLEVSMSGRVDGGEGWDSSGVVRRDSGPSGPMRARPSMCGRQGAWLP